MNNNELIIGILDPSIIVYEGLSSIFHKSNLVFKLVKIDNLDDINDSLFYKYHIKILIVNPTYTQNTTKEFKKLKKNYPEILWIGFIYNFFDNETISLFDETISITENPENICKNLEKIITENFYKNSNKIEEQLSEREVDVLIQLVKGLTNKEIAEQLNISIHTVISHRKNITLKTGIKSQSGLTIYAITKNIISLDKIS